MKIMAHFDLVEVQPTVDRQTSDHLLPKQALYQTELHSDIYMVFRSGIRTHMTGCFRPKELAPLRLPISPSETLFWRREWDSNPRRVETLIGSCSTAELTTHLDL